MNKRKLALMVGMHKIICVYNNALIGYCKGLSGVCIAFEEYGLRGVGLSSTKHAKQFIDNLYNNKEY